MTERTSYDKIMISIFNPPQSSGEKLFWVKNVHTPIEYYSSCSNCLNHPWSFERSAYDIEIMKTKFKR